MIGIRKLVGHVETIFRYPVKSLRGRCSQKRPSHRGGSSLGIHPRRSARWIPMAYNHENADLYVMRPDILNQASCASRQWSWLHLMDGNWPGSKNKWGIRFMRIPHLRGFKTLT
jgi:hypothetical protein